jgi:type IV secretion system protein VirD4
MTTGHRLLLCTTALGGGALAIMSAASQWAAQRLSFHPALGTPWIGHYYAPWSLFLWNRAPWASQVKWTLGIADAAALIAVLAAIVPFAIYVNLKRRQPKRYPALYGTATFQDEAGLRRTGLLDGAGIYIGGWRAGRGHLHYLRDNSKDHVLVLAPTRSGKTAGPLLMTMNSWGESAIVFDPKGEIHDLSAMWRSRHANNTVWRFEPGAKKGSCGYNPLSFVRVKSEHAVADAQAVALILCDPHGRGLDEADHWTKASFSLLSALIIHVLRTQGNSASLSDVAKILSRPDQSADELWDEMCSSSVPYVARGGRDMKDRAVRERASVLSSAKTFLLLFSDEIVSRNTNHSDFRLADIAGGEKPTTVYLVTKGMDLERLRPIIRLFLTQAIRFLMSSSLPPSLAGASNPHKHRTLLLIDEMPSLGKLELLEAALSRASSYGVRCLLAAQDREQIMKAYGPQNGIIANCGIRILISPNDIGTAEWASKLGGTTTAIIEQITQSGPRFGWFKTVTRNYQQMARPLLTPAEILTLKKPTRDKKGDIVAPGEMLVFMSGEPVLKCEQALYFLDPIFARRAQIDASTVAQQPGPEAGG